MAFRHRLVNSKSNPWLYDNKWNKMSFQIQSHDSSPHNIFAFTRSTLQFFLLLPKNQICMNALLVTEVKTQVDTHEFTVSPLEVLHTLFVQRIMNANTIVVHTCTTMAQFHCILCMERAEFNLFTCNHAFSWLRDWERLNAQTEFIRVCLTVWRPSAQKIKYEWTKN